MADINHSMQTFESYLDTGYDQVHRPQFHFTSRKNWLNDPNGLIYCDGVYHMYFQHNPESPKWGNMTWGHATSTDRVHWTQHPHAILPYDGGTIFSGTAVIDHNNSLGKQQGDVKTLVACFTFAKEPYNQAIAYSTDNGKTLTLLNDGQCVVPNQGLIQSDRDPKVLWHEPTQKWVMVLYVDKGIARIFTSEDLQNWTFASDVEREGFHECPDFIELPVLDTDGQPTGETRWLLYDACFVCSIGQFDGETFTIEKSVPKQDLGKNFYAAQTFSNSPDGRTVIVGWMGGSQFIEQDMPFSEQMSFPSTMELRETADEIRLYRWPIQEIETLYTATHTFADATADTLTEQLAEINAELVDMSIAFAPGEDLTLTIRGLEIRYDSATQTFNSDCCKTPMPTHPVDGLVKLRVLVDRGSIELFANEGSAVATTYVLPDPENTNIMISGKAQVSSLAIHELRSSW